MRRRGASVTRQDRVVKARPAGRREVAAHPLFAPLVRRSAGPTWGDPGDVAPDGWATVNVTGSIVTHPGRLGAPEEWTWVFAHLLLHLGLGHLDPARSAGVRFDGWCDVVRIRREHAFLVPAGAMLPFTPRGPLFRMA